jgi:hypothetical protein
MICNIMLKNRDTHGQHFVGDTRTFSTIENVASCNKSTLGEVAL